MKTIIQILLKFQNKKKGLHQELERFLSETKKRSSPRIGTAFVTELFSIKRFSPLPPYLPLNQMQNKENTTFLALLRLFFALE